MKMKQRIKDTILKNEIILKCYTIYHEYAKYVYQIGKPKFTIHEMTNLTGFLNHPQTFFGYYDKSPERNGHYIYHVVNSNTTDLHQSIDIYVDERKIGSSEAWNWQQGTMLSWLNDREIIYNIFKNHSYQAAIVNIETNQFRYISTPIYKVSRDGSFALSLNFRRLARLRPDYGYINLPYNDLERLDVNDGVFYIDLINNRTKLLVSFEMLIKLNPLPSMENAWHKVNHIDLSPDQKKIIFLHRWYDVNDLKHTRLVMYDLSAERLSVLADEDMISHCTWRNDNEIVGYLRYDSKDRYYRINITTKEINLLSPSEELVDDGHPGFSVDGRYMITDTYPDFTCKSRLLLYDTKTGKLLTIGQFYSPKRYKGVKRCDLHPRWSQNGEEITFDAVFEQTRHLYRLDIRKLLGEGADNGKN
ncbi:hypothetical protein SDC9_99793 [bioreactor metagenome]|uniref:Protein TolB n=1 Tax=bioreactor metagenome TaxID=1076179 RepID=A0A645AIN0_9ZZZZ|nr:hypothetical protein [Erysipelotrichaceae bacterium]